jgi:hypothetical protein
MGVGRFPRPLREVGEIAMPDAGLDIMRCDEFSPGTGVLQLLVVSITVGVFIDCCCVADGAKVTCCGISATRELFSDHKGVQATVLRL